MAGQPGDLMRLELDTAQAEAKTRNLIELLGKVAIAGANKQDTSGLERQINAEVEVLSRSTGKTKEAQSTIEAVIKQKEKLGSVIAVLGGQFAGYTGQLGNVVQLFMTLGTAAVLPAAVLTGITLFARAWAGAAEEIKKAREEEERVLALERQRLSAGRGAQTSFASKAEAWGLYGYGEKGSRRAKEIEEGGVSLGLAEFQSIAEGLGLSPEEAAAAGRGVLIGGDASPTRNAHERLRKLDALARLGRTPEAEAAMGGHMQDFGESARLSSYSRTFDEVSTTNYAGALNKFIADNNVPADVAAKLRRALHTGERNDSSWVPVSLRWQADAMHEYNTDVAADRLADDFRARGLNRTVIEGEAPPAPTIIINEGPRYQTAYFGSGNIHADPSSSVAQRSPGASNGARSQTP